MRPWLSALSALWARRSLRARLVVLSVVPLVVGLLAVSGAVVLLFSAGRIRDVDRQTRAEATTLAELVSTAQVTSPLPLPAGSPLLAQVIDVASRTVTAASRSASLVLPLVDVSGGGGRARSFTVDDDPYGAVALRVRAQPASLHGQPVVVVVAAPLADIRDALRALEIVLLVVVPILVVLIGVLEWTVIGLTLRPVERLRAAAGAMAAETAPVSPRADGSGRGSAAPARLPVGAGGDEITRLAETLNLLLSRLQVALDHQRAFVSDAAHELRSPLASMRVQLDIAQAHPDLLGAQELAAELSAEVHRLTRLTDDLLLLGRLDSRTPVARRRVDLSEIAETSDPPAVVDGDPEELRRLVRNLVENARNHAGSVRVTVSRDEGFAVLRVDDDGPGIPAADRDRVFDRWTRLDPARDRGRGGSGLGLAIVRDVAAAHGGTVRILDSPLGGTRVELRIPLSQ